MLHPVCIIKDGIRDNKVPSVSDKNDLNKLISKSQQNRKLYFRLLIK